MEKAKEIASDPVKLEAALKKAWEKVDPEKKGYATYDVVKEAIKEQVQKLGLPEKKPTPEQIEAAKKLVDPEGTGKITFENFEKAVKAKVEEAKAAGKI